MTIQESVEELRTQIASLEFEIASPLATVCTHLICPACELALAEEKKTKEILQIKLDEKRQLYEKIKSYGSNE